MTLLGRLLGRGAAAAPARIEPSLRASPENPATSLSNPDAWFVNWASGGPTAAGPAINERTALNIIAVTAAARRIAQTVASLPLILYRRSDDDRVRAANHPLHWLLHNQPNPEMTAFEYWEMAAGHVELWGNHVAEIERDGAGRAAALWPITPGTWRVGRHQGRKFFVVTLPEGGEVVLPAADVLHIPGWRFDGLVGLSTVGLAREALGLTAALQEYGARYFANNGRAATVLEHPGKLSQPAQEQIIAAWNAKMTGLGNAHRTAILAEGMKATFNTVPNEDAQFLESRRFQVREIARMFLLPPHMLGDYEGMSLSNFEQQALDFVVHSIRPRLVRIEQRVNMQLVPASAQGSLFAEFLADALLRADTKSRFEAYGLGIQWGVLKPGEARARENLPRDTVADVLLRPANMVPMDAPPPAADPAPPPEPAPAA